MIWYVVIAVAATSIVLVAIQTSRIAIIRAIQESSEREQSTMATNQEQLVELQTILTAIVSQQGGALRDLDAKIATLEANSTADFGPVRALVDQLKAGVQTLDDYTPTTIEAEEGTTPTPEPTPGETPDATPPVDTDTGADIDPETGETGTDEDDTEDVDSETSQP